MPRTSPRCWSIFPFSRANCHVGGHNLFGIAHTLHTTLSRLPPAMSLASSLHIEDMRRCSSLSVLSDCASLAAVAILSMRPFGMSSTILASSLTQRLMMRLELCRPGTSSPAEDGAGDVTGRAGADAAICCTCCQLDARVACAGVVAGVP